ncbi:NAD(P)HX epimerase [Lunatimonas lonarensis]|uniref:Bifunctional NAD(P)H-hydrate repair enzyme n=1 Tax=Lunatimonas lonarensis TaxID=1232681 RepID=R7ZZA4_9BACT|nr:bifunctional ADP-dependent NAD(P)H-hydrate dehydratase/NAD(P)H-hydrate epimerase [Lunatimonas lonarensis]EON79425.1 NAD(P)HX epimerase [Lunatimonas lonarensis]
MQKILSGLDVKRLDKEFIEHEGISSLDLMERAANAFVAWLQAHVQDKTWKLTVVCGTGNNGGDGVAVARLLVERGYEVGVFVVGDPSKGSEDFKSNLMRLPKAVSYKHIQEVSELLLDANLVVDAIFGVGINRPLEGIYRSVVEKMNQSGIPIIAVDLPSGLPADSILEGIAIKASHTVSFQFPKISLLIPEHAFHTGELIVVSIGMDVYDYSSFSGDFYYLNAGDIRPLHRRFDRFSHKGTYGKVLMIGGSFGKMGAVILGCKAALRCGSGLVSAFVPACGVVPIQSSVPEAMVETSMGSEFISLPLPDLGRFTAIGIGPGMGVGKVTREFFEAFLNSYRGPAVIDADGINLLSGDPGLFSLLEGKVLTPHLIEFERLVGKCSNHLVRLEKAKEFAVNFGCILVLKGANSVISLPDGRQLVNSTGTKYMATGGSGDVLTGMICSFLGQGYSPEDATTCAVFHHGLAGELAAMSRWRGTIASDIVESIPQTFVKLGIS